MTKREIGESRERAIATLTEAFARDDLELDELEERLAKVQAADSLDAIATVVTDLVPATAPIPPRAIVPAADALAAQRILAILGSTEQGGTWTGARRIRAASILGSTVIDFRNARLPAGVVDLEVSALLGSVEIIVPPDLAVEMHGSGILGSFEAVNRAPASPDEERPTLRIHGVAALGSVEVITRLSGETEKDARKRLKAAEQKKQLKSGL